MLYFISIPPYTFHILEYCFSDAPTDIMELDNLYDCSSHGGKFSKVSDFIKTRRFFIFPRIRFRRSPQETCWPLPVEQKAVLGSTPRTLKDTSSFSSWLFPVGCTSLDHLVGAREYYCFAELCRGFSYELNMFYQKFDIFPIRKSRTLAYLVDINQIDIWKQARTCMKTGSKRKSRC